MAPKTLRLSLWLREWGLLIVLAVVILAINLHSIAACGPWDPWETHYGEVARQILARRNPLDLWWQPGYGPDGRAETTFWSKPALPFWLMAGCMALFGVGRGAPDEMVRSPWPELAIRLPSMVAGLLSAAFLGYVVYRLHSRNDDKQRARARLAGGLTAVVLATMPQWAIVTRQALTDMFFVGPVVIAIGAWALAVLQPDRPLNRRPLRWPGVARRRGWTIPWDRAHLGFLLAFATCVVSQLSPLHGFVRSDAAAAAVAEYAGRPGPPTPFALYQIHLTMLIYWGLALVAVLLSLRWRSRARCWLAIMYLAGGASLIGKGMIGPGLIGLLVLLHMVVSGRLSLLRSAGLWTGALLFSLVALPWHHAMYLYRGDAWFNELIVINNLARFATGEQEQAVGGFTFYLRTLGLAALPWVAALPAALWTNFQRAYGACPKGHEENASPTRALRRLLLVWLVVSLALLTYSVTKYYHYLLPALPPAAALLGLWLADLTEPGEVARLHQAAATAWTLALVGAAFTALIVREALHEPSWIAHLTTYLYTGMWKDGAPETTPLVYCAAPMLIALVLWALRRLRSAIAAATLAGLLTTGYVVDDYLPAASENWSQRSALRAYFDHRAPGDPLLSWWFYYRGETFFAKADVWILKERDRERFHEYLDDQKGSGATLWIMTTRVHAKRLPQALPGTMRDGLETVYENFHYSLLKVPAP